MSEGLRGVRFSLASNSTFNRWDSQKSQFTVKTSLMFPNKCSVSICWQSQIQIHQWKSKQKLSKFKCQASSVQFLLCFYILNKPTSFKRPSACKFIKQHINSWKGLKYIYKTTKFHWWIHGYWWYQWSIIFHPNNKENVIIAFIKITTPKNCTVVYV